MLLWTVHVNNHLHSFIQWDSRNVHLLWRWTAVLLTVMMAISLHSKVDAFFSNKGENSTLGMAPFEQQKNLFEYLSCYCSEPASDKCNNQTQTHGKSDWTTIVVSTVETDYSRFMAHCIDSENLEALLCLEIEDYFYGDRDERIQQ
ncbi:hypothetical protein LINPERHAP1_LOCUS26035 [Linum perenne]